MRKFNDVCRLRVRDALMAVHVLLCVGACRSSGAEGAESPVPGDSARGDTPLEENDSALDAVVDSTPPCSAPPPSAKCAHGWCRVEPGCFVMGARRGELGAAAHSDVQVQVTLTRAFLIQETETTQAAWAASGLPNPSGATASIQNCLEPTCPVGNLTWYDAAAYANHLSRSAVPPLPECYAFETCEGVPGAKYVCKSVKVNAPTIYECAGYRLPTEAEWEYAARAGTFTAFYSGEITAYPDRTACNSDANLEKIGWYCNNSALSTHPVKQKAANAWGLFDVSGNVAEWVNDQFDGFGYGSGPLVDPQGSFKDPNGRVLRGGAAAAPAVLCKSSYRFDVPSFARSPGTGVRLVRTATPSE